MDLLDITQCTQLRCPSCGNFQLYDMTMWNAYQGVSIVWPLCTLCGVGYEVLGTPNQPEHATVAQPNEAAP